MTKPTETLVEFPRRSARDVLTEVLRTGARQLLATAIEAEVDEYVAARAKTVDAAGRRGVVRNGHLPKRALQTPLGDITVQQPRVRDRRPDDERETFRSAILPPYLRKTPSLEALYPWLSLKGLIQLTVELAAYSCRCHAGVEPSATPTIASNFSRISASISATGTCSTSS